VAVPPTRFRFGGTATGFVMTHLIGRTLRLLARPFRLAARRPLLTAAVLAVAAVGLLFAGWRYAVHEWQQAEADVREERFQEARRRLDVCLRVWPQSTDVHLLAARTARRTGDLAAAEGHLNRCLELNAGATDRVQVEFLLLRVQAGEVDELATPLFDLVARGHPDSREILDTIARAYSHRMRYRLTYACLTRWIEVEPDYAKPYYWRGWVQERLNNQKGATVDYHKAIEIDPDLVPARLRIAEMLLEDKQAPEAEPHLAILMRLAPDDPQVRSRLGICRFLQGDAAEARRLLEGSLPQLGNDAAVLVTLANIDIQEERAADAERRLRDVLRFDASDTEALFVLAAALQMQGKSAEAEAALAEHTRKRQVVDRINDLLKEKADGPNATAADYVEIGTLFLSIGRERLGVYWLERATEKDPACQPAHRALADHYETKGDAAATAFHRRQVRGPDPKQP
jgi:tetratricopeptide (TPR) repeat protein